MSSNQVISAIANVHKDILAMRAEIASLQSIIATLTTQGVSNNSISSGSSTQEKPKKEAKQKRKVKLGEDGKPVLNSWVIFTNRVRELCQDKGVQNLLFCKDLKAAHETDYASLSDDAIKAARASWVAPPVEPKKGGKKGKDESATESSSVVTGTTTTTNVLENNTTTSSVATEKKKRGPKAGTKRATKKVKEAANVELPPSEDNESVKTSDDAEPDWSPIVYKGKKYLYNPADGSCYHREGETTRLGWAGIFNPKDPQTGKPKLDTSAQEPSA